MFCTRAVIFLLLLFFFFFYFIFILLYFYLFYLQHSTSQEELVFKLEKGGAEGVRECFAQGQFEVLHYSEIYITSGKFVCKILSINFFLNFIYLLNSMCLFLKFHLLLNSIHLYSLNSCIYLLNFIYLFIY